MGTNLEARADLLLEPVRSFVKEWPGQPLKELETPSWHGDLAWDLS